MEHTWNILNSIISLISSSAGSGRASMVSSSISSITPTFTISLLSSQSPSESPDPEQDAWCPGHAEAAVLEHEVHLVTNLLSLGPTVCGVLHAQHAPVFRSHQNSIPFPLHTKLTQKTYIHQISGWWSFICSGILVTATSQN